MSTQRLLAMKTPLGETALVPTGLAVSEAVGEPYLIEVQAVGSRVNLTGADLLGQPVTVSVTPRVDGSTVKRFFHGTVVEFARLGPAAAGGMGYRLVAAPPLWKAGLNQTSAIYQDRTVKAIVDEVLGDEGGMRPTWKATGSFEPIPYCTRFNESGLGFAARLLEEHGLTYFFTHRDGGCDLVIADAAQGFPMFEGGSILARHATPDFDELGGWSRVQRARFGEAALTDMDEERVQPSKPLSASTPSQRFDGEPSRPLGGKVKPWPGGMSTRPKLEVAKIMMQREEAASEHFRATARDPRFGAGMRVQVGVVNEAGEKENAQYAVTGVRHEASDHSALTSGAGGIEDYAATLRLVAAARPLRPPLRHPRPVMAGLHSATVTGPKGEKIHTDALGRIKVRFRWDYDGKQDDTSSIWVRVMQPAAGAWGGAWFLPRVGDEVMVAFLDGDPDRPIVVGSAYGQDAKPPFDPGANKTQTGYSTRSYKSDAKADANVLRFEDKKGSEEVLLHAQKDLTVEVENDEKRTIDNARTTLIKKSHDTYTLEEGNRTETIKKGNDTYSLDTGNREHTIKQGNDTYTLSMGNRAEAIKTGNDSLKIDKGNLSVELGMGNESHAIKMGNVTIKCDLGAVTIEAMQKITLKVGANSIEVSPQGVTIKGIMVNVEGTAMTTVKAPMTSVKGDGMVQIQGGVVMIN